MILLILLTASCQESCFCIFLLFSTKIYFNEVDIELETKSFIVIPNFLHSILISGKISSFEELQFMIPFIQPLFFVNMLLSYLYVNALYKISGIVKGTDSLSINIYRNVASGDLTKYERSYSVLIDKLKHITEMPSAKL